MDIFCNRIPDFYYRCGRVASLPLGGSMFKLEFILRNKIGGTNDKHQQHTSTTAGGLA